MYGAAAMPAPPPPNYAGEVGAIPSYASSPPPALYVAPTTLPTYAASARAYGGEGLRIYRHEGFRA